MAENPTTLAEAILYADAWYHDSGFRAFLTGWCMGRGETMWDEQVPPEVLDRGILDRAGMVRWARDQHPFTRETPAARSERSPR